MSNTDELIARLRDWSDGPDTDDLCRAAADEIERLRAAVLGHETNCMTKAREIEALRNSLAECVEDSEEVLATHLQAYGEKYRVQRADFLRAQISTARALLAGKAVTP
jgi:hypothetical protein